MQEIFSIAESAKDCREIRNWAKRNNKEIKIIALSLDAYLSNLSDLYIWKMLPMDQLMSDAYMDSQRLGEEWGRCFSKDQSGLYDQAVRFQLSEEFLYHGVLSMKVAKKLSALFKKNNWIYLSGRISPQFVGAYTPNIQKKVNDNLLFKSIALEEMRFFKVPILYINWTDRFCVQFAKKFLYWSILNRFIFDFFEYIYSFLKRKNNKIERQLNNLANKSNINAVFSGWGRDLSRILSLDKLQSAAKSKEISVLNIILRPAKLKSFNPLPESEKFQTIVFDEDVRNGISYGIRASAFDFSIFINFIYFFIKVVLRRWKRIKDLSKFDNSENVYKYSAVSLNARFIVAFAYRSVFLEEKAIIALYRKIKPNFYVCSDSGGASERFELLKVKEMGSISLSVPHGYASYSEPAYLYEADIVGVPSFAVKEIIRLSGIESEKIYVIGSSHPRGEVKNLSKRVNIVIGTRSRRGLWSNHSSRHDIYDQCINSLVEGLLRDSRFHIVIKSHPNGDLFEYYDLLVEQKKNPNIEHIRRKFTLDEFFEKTDILVCIGEAPGFFVSAIYGNIPIVFVDGCMSKVNKELNYRYSGVSAIASTGDEAVEKIKRITEDQRAYNKAVDFQKEGTKDFESDQDPERKIMEIISTYGKRK